MSKSELHPVPRAIMRAVGAVAAVIDTGLEKVADKPLERLYEANKARAEKNPDYAAIEAKRRVAGSEHILMISQEHGLDGDAWELQMRIWDDGARHPWWEKPARAISNRPLTKALSALQRRGERARRGWDHQALWSLDTHLCATLGAQLTGLADIAHGWPQSETYPDYDDWIAALRDNAAKLTAYGNKWDLDINPYGEESEQVYKDAQDALRWVADNLGALWD